MAKVLGRSFFFAVLLAIASPARAEPLLMFLIGFARNVAESNSAPRPVVPPPPVQSTAYGGTNVEPAILKRLIDDSFTYLTPPQRDEVFLALHTELVKPENFAVRAPMIEHFVVSALQVRAAQARLARLSTPQKQVLADELRKEAKSMPEEEVVLLRQALQKNLLPVPSDLNQLLLVAID